MRKNPLLSPPDDYESPGERLLRQERALITSFKLAAESPIDKIIRREQALIDSINAAAESPIEKIIRQQASLMESLNRASESVLVFDRIKESIDKMAAAPCVIRKLDKPVDFRTFRPPSILIQSGVL